MRDYRLELVEKTSAKYELRCYDPAQDAPPIAQYPLDGKAVREFIERAETQYKSFAGLSLARLGQDLYTWLEQSTHGCLSDLRGQATAVALHMDGGAGLRHLPWELLHDGQAFLCGNPERRFTPVRRDTQSEVAARGHDPQNRYLRVLFMASSPEDALPELKFEQEEARILEVVRRKQLDLDLVVEESGSLEGLERLVAEYEAGYFDVVHLTGHADVDGEEAFFWLENDVGRKQKATASDLVAAFNGRFPRLLFLSGCQTGRPAAGLPSLSEALVRAGVPAVLGWALPVGDPDATAAAAGLYAQLAAGERLDWAVAAARWNLLEAGSEYWHLLRLFANADPLAELVTTRRARGRERLRVKEAAQVFLDADSQRMPVCDRGHFVGRRRLLQQALRVLRGRPGDGAPGLLLHGMGGLGKSSLAARLCDRLKPSHEQAWVWVGGGIDEDELRRVIADKARKPEVNALLSEPGLTLAQRLTEVLEKHVTDPVLFVFDDFEHNAEAENAPTPAGSARPDRFTPRTRASDNRLILKPAADAALRALLKAIDDSGSESRVIVTCRQQLADLPLSELGLRSMQGAEWDKKIRALPAFAENAEVAATLQDQAKTLAAGNPRLLEWLDKVLADANTDSASVLAALADKTAEFREHTLLDALLDQLPDHALRLLALLALYELPVPEAALVALLPPPAPAEGKASSTNALAENLPRLIHLGLAEHWRGDEKDGYFVSSLVTPLLAGVLNTEERQTALQAAVHALYKLWWQESNNLSEIQALEIRRLAHLANAPKIAADITTAIATLAVNTHRYRDAQRWCEETLKLGEDYRLWYTLARAENVLGESDALAHYERALALAPPITEGTDKNTQKEYGALIYNYAELLVQLGQIEKALALYQESLSIDENLQDFYGKATTLHQMAGVIAQQGDIPRALQLWHESLELYDKIGDVRGKAATFHQMAGVIARQGDGPRALQLWHESLGLLEKVGDVQGKAATLHEMAGARPATLARVPGTGR